MPGPVTRMDESGLVFSCHDEEGVIEVVDDLDTRALYFGTSARQSAMSREEPHRLVLSYTRAMLSGLLFTRQPRSALVLGLGGGSLPRFLMHVFPTCRIDVVERRAKVVQVAHDYFHLARSPRLRTHVCDAEVFLRFRDRVAAAGIAVPLVPGILPVTNFAQLKRMAASCGASIPAWMGAHFDGLDDDPDTRRLVAASLAAEQCRRLHSSGVHEFHFYTLNRADLIVAICHLLGVRAPKPAAAVV